MPTTNTLRFVSIMRERCAVAVLGMMLFGGMRTAVAQPVSSPAPSPAATQTPALICPAAVLRIFLVDAGTATGWTYAIEFESFADVPGTLSGTVSLFAGNHRYDVPFTDAIAVPAVSKAVQDAVPIVVRFRTDVGVEAAYLSAIAGPNPGPCGFGDIAQLHRRLSDPDADMKGQVLQVDAAAVERARRIAPVAAPEPIFDPVSCAEPDALTKATYAAKPAYPDIAGIRGDEGEVVVAVQLTDRGERTAAWIWQASGSRLLDEAGFAAAIRSTFKAGTFRCKPVFDVYFFGAWFRSGNK
jgi:TonB family protein